MPLSEFLKMARGKLESGQQKISSTTPLSSFPEDDLVELKWQNGQIVMQGQSSSAKKSPVRNNASGDRDKYTGNSSTSKIGKFGLMDSMLNDMSLSVPTGELDLIQEDEGVPWLGYSADDSLQQDYCSQLLPEISVVTANNEPSGQSIFGLMNKRGSSDKVIGDSHSVPVHNAVDFEQRNTSKVSPSSRFSLLSSLTSQKGHGSIPTLESGVPDIFSSKNCNTPMSVLGDSSQSQASAGDVKSDKIQKQNMPGNRSNLLNFSHFSRPTTFVKAAKLQNTTGGSNVSGSSILDAKGKKGGEKVTIGDNHVSAAAAENYLTSKKENVLHYPSNVVSSQLESRASGASFHDRSCHGEQSDNVFRDCSSNNDNTRGQFTGAKETKDIADGERNVEHGVACSSVCSGSSAERGSSDQPLNLKRKTRDNEESECRSEDVEEESVGIKKTCPARGGTGSKRSRAAEVHNLSERRRRDRINEKMRALQELIPNCNKADKASMLDEAIEYLKTLQLQVQIMSMGAGFCVPPMMFPTGVQHMHAAQMPHFSPMGLGMGMGMGMGFGMGMLEMNGRTSGCPIFPMPSVQGGHFPSPPVPASTAYPGIAVSNRHAFAHPGQGLPMSIPRASLGPLAGQLSTGAAVPLNVARAGVPVEIPSAPPILDSKNPVHKNSQIVHNAEPSHPLNQTCSQVQATNDVLDKSVLVQKNDQLPDVTDSAANSLTNRTNVSGNKTGPSL